MSIKKNGEERYVGRVVEAGYKVERVMSDVYDDVPYAYVLKDDGSYERISEYDMRAVVDATPEQIEAYKVYEVARLARIRAEYEAQAAQYRAEEVRLAAEKAVKVEALRAKNLAAEAGIVVAKGDVVKVLSGAAKGKAGRVFWMGDGKLGTKLGIALDDQKDVRGYHSNVAWVLKKNVAKAA